MRLTGMHLTEMRLTGMTPYIYAYVYYSRPICAYCVYIENWIDFLLFGMWQMVVECLAVLPDFICFLVGKDKRRDKWRSDCLWSVAVLLLPNHLWVRCSNACYEPVTMHAAGTQLSLINVFPADWRVLRGQQCRGYKITYRTWWKPPVSRYISATMCLK